MPVSNKTHILLSHYEAFLLLCILQVREERKKRQRCHTVLICTEKDRGNESRKAPLAACYDELPEVWTRKWKKLFSGASSSCRDYGDHCWLLFSCPVMSDSLQLHGLWPRCLCPWDISARNTGVSCHFLLQGFFPTQGLNLDILFWQANSLLPCHKGSSKSK